MVGSTGSLRRARNALARLRGAKIEVVTRQLHAKVAAVEAVIKEARALSMRINAWEWR